MEARWPQAVDVFQLIAEVISARQYPRLVVEACTALGAAARSAGDWTTSNHAYARAEHLAAEIGDRELGLMVQIGLAGSQMIQGNLPAADAELDEVFAKAGEGKYPRIEAKALHARASVAHCRGDYQRAVNLAYRSLELTTDGSDRERLLADIAAAYAGLGMRAAARDGYTIVSVTSPHQWVRWQATLNLMELAIEDGDAQAFDDFLNQMEGARLDPRLRTYHLYFRARGMRVFDRPGWESEFAAAQHYAETHHYTQLAHEIETARIAPPVLPAADGSSEPPAPAPTEDLRRIAEVLEHLRETASA
jgi:ATP/maltotriose-dependent transcriptional regulator MalT